MLRRVLLASFLILAAPACGSTDDGASTNESRLDLAGSDIPTRARLLLDSETGITIDEALVRAASAVTTQKGSTLAVNDVDVEYLVRRLGPGALPFMLERPWRREQLVSEWAISEAEAFAIVRAFADRGASDVVANVIDALIRHPALSDAAKRQLITASLTSVAVDETGRAKVDPALATPISALQLAQRLLTSHEPYERALLASLLSTKAFGFDAFPAGERKSAIDALLGDAEFTVRIAASGLFWEGTHTTRAEQTAVFAVLDDPNTVAQVRLSQIFSMGWSRERAGMWGMPAGTEDRLLDARAVILGTLLEKAPKTADISYLLEQADAHGSFANVSREAALRLMESPSYTVAQKATWLEKLVDNEDDLAPVVIRFAWEHPELGPSLPKSMASLAVYRFEEHFGPQVDADRLAWIAQVATPNGLKQGFRDALQTRGANVFARPLLADEGPLVRQVVLDRVTRAANGEDVLWFWTFDGAVELALDVGIPATTLLQHVTKVFKPNGFPSQADAVSALLRVAKDPSVDRPTLLTMLGPLLPYAAKYWNYLGAIEDADFVAAFAMTYDSRLTAADRAALLTPAFAAASTWGARRAADVLRSKGMTSAAIATLAGDKPVLLFDVSPIAMSPALFTPLTPRYQVLATRLGVSSMDETAVRAKIEGYLGKPVNTYWTQAGAERRWIATPRPWPPASSLFATPANTITQDTLLLFAGAPDLGTLSDAQVTSFFSRAGWTLDIVEPYWFEADVARGKSYDALKAAHGAKAPLAWQEADGRRSAGESAALEALLARTPAASPLWEGALLNAAARSAHVSDGYKRSMLLGAMTSGYMQSTSVDTSWDAFEALQGCTSCETGFARPRLLVYAGRLRSMADARDLFALEPLLVDARMPEETVRDTLLVAVDASVKAHDYPQFDHPARALSATVIRTLDARTDLSAPTRQVLLRATDRLIDVARGGAAP